MIAFEVSLNGERMYLAGAEDLTVLSAQVTAIGKLGDKTAQRFPDDTTSDIHYNVSGLTVRPNRSDNLFVEWAAMESLQVGDVLEVRIVETEEPDLPTSLTPRMKPPDRGGERAGVRKADGNE